MWLLCGPEPLQIGLQVSFSIHLLLLPKPWVGGADLTRREAKLTGSPALLSVMRPYVNCFIAPSLIWEEENPL